MDTGYEYWREALAGRFGPVHDGEPQVGFWRKKNKDGPATPVAIYRDTLGIMWAKEGNRESGAYADDLWTWVCRNPVTHEAYLAAMAGKGWSDVDSAITPPPPMGHNKPPGEAETLADQIASARAGIKQYDKIEDDETQARAQSLRARLNELSREADKQREAEKKPHLEAGKAVDAIWQPLVKSAKEGADAVAKSMGAWETAKARKADEERRKAEEAVVAARRAEQEAWEEGQPTPPKPEPVVIPAPAPVATVIRGGYGRAATVKVVKVLTAVTDQAALYGFLSNHPTVIQLFKDLAQRALDAGLDVPGVEFEEQRKVA